MDAPSSPGWLEQVLTRAGRGPSQKHPNSCVRLSVVGQTGTPKVTSTCWNGDVTGFGEKGLRSFPGVRVPAAKDSVPSSSHEGPLGYIQKLGAEH